jgi:hypothetical protein
MPYPGAVWQPCMVPDPRKLSLTCLPDPRALGVAAMPGPSDFGSFVKVCLGSGPGLFNIYIYIYESGVVLIRI